MKNNSKGLLLAAVAVSFGLASCSDESPWRGSDTEGGINLEFSSDARVMRQTRADDSVSPFVPAADHFSVSLTKSDGTFTKTWTGVESFNRETAFAIGDYTLAAFYGDAESEGFECPFYKGSADVHVSPGAVTDATVVATLANSMVSIRYTDKFNENFSDYSSSVQTEGHDWVVFAKSETRPAYIASSDVKVKVRLTNDAGKTVEVVPAQFTAQPRHHYVVTLDVEETAGGLALDVVFDEDVVAETVEISLTDELFSAPAPTVTAKGFDAPTPVETFEFAEQAAKPEFHCFAFGGLRQATLNVVSSNGYSPAFGRRVELVGADELTQAQLASEGVDCAGFFRNVDKMGVVNLKGFIESLPAGSYEISLEIEDQATRVSEPVKMDVTVKPVTFSLEAPIKAEFLGSELTVDVLTNCPDIRNKVSFKVPDVSNRMVPAEIKSVTQVDGTRAEGQVRLRYVLAMSARAQALIDVEAHLRNRVAETQVSMIEPEYTITPDAYARKVVLRINAADERTARFLRDNLIYYNGDTQISSSNVSHGADGLITISRLTPAIQYMQIKAKVAAFEKAVPAFTTESETDVPNGTFTASTQTININPINTGGQYTGTRLSKPKYQLISSIERPTPDGWANVNERTCYAGSSNKNTWYLVPSTWEENGQAVLRSAGYSHNGKDLGVTNKTSVYYCQNAPADADLQKAAGELFLGSYSFNGSESRTDGMAWTSRPATLSFDYSYTPYNNERGEAYVRIFDASGKVIAQQTLYLAASSTMTTKTVALTGYPFGVKAAKIELGFRSTESGVAPAVYIPKGEELKETAVDWKTFTDPGSHPISANNYRAVATGSKLVLDNVRLGYVDSANALPTARPRRK